MNFVYKQYFFGKNRIRFSNLTVLQKGPSGSDGPGKKKMVAGEKAYSALLSFLALAFSSSVAHADDHHGRGHVGGGSHDSGKGHNRLKLYLEELLYRYVSTSLVPHSRRVGLCVCLFQGLG